MNRLVAVVAGRCPRCLRGSIWRHPFSMNELCPVCAFRFEREAGYWTGAMVASYLLGVPLLAVLVLGVWFLTRWDVIFVLVAADLLFLVLAPLVWRYSRVVWLHLDWLLDPAHT